jgi:hypothetical protein
MQIHLSLALLALLACLLCSTAFRVPSLALASRRGSMGAVTIPGPSYSQSSTSRDAFPSSMFNIAAGLEADTLGAIGNVQELNEAMEGVIDTSNPAVGKPSVCLPTIHYYYPLSR